MSSGVANYVDAMHAFRSGSGKHAAVPGRPEGKVARSSNGRKLTSPTKGLREKGAGRIQMARKSKAKRKAAKHRKRDASGHFVKSGKRSAKKRPSAKQRAAWKKNGARLRRMAKGKRKARKSSGKRRVKRRSKKRHTVRGHYRKASPKQAAKGRKRVRVPKHMSWEEMAMAKKAPRRRRRKARRAHAREMVVAEAPKKRRRRRKAKKAAAPKRRRRSAKRRAAPRRRRRRSSGASATVRASVRKRRSRRAKPGTIRITLATPKRKTSRRRRRSSARRRKTGSRRRKARRSSRRSRSTSLVLPAMGEFMSNPLGEHPLSNPLSGGEMALALVTGALGYAAADVLDRFLATNAATPLTGAAASNAILGIPSVTRIAAQVGLTAAPMALAYFVHQPMGRAALQGMALGSGFHLLGQLTKALVFGKALAGNNTVAMQLYPDVVGAEAANASATAAAPTTGSTGTTGPLGLGAPYGRSALRGRDVGPYATVRGVGDASSSCGGNSATCGCSKCCGTPPNVKLPPTGDCTPCGATSMQAAMSSAYGAARDDSPDCGPSSGNGLAGMPNGAPGHTTARPWRMEIPD